MSNRFEADGNLGNAPELRTVTVAGGKERDVMDFSVYVERRVPDGNGGYEDKGGFWLNGSLWGGRARVTHEQLKKGMRVHVAGTLYLEEQRETDTGETYPPRFKLDADYVLIDPITYARRDR